MAHRLEADGDIVPQVGEIVRLDKGLAKTHRLAVELFSGSGDEQGR